VVITKGRFQFKGTVDHPQQARLQLPPAGTSYTHMMREDVAIIYLEKGTITVTGTGQPMQAVATGAPLNHVNAALIAQTAPLQAQLTALQAAEQRRPAAERADTAHAHQADAQEAQLTKQLQAVYAAYLQAHPASPFSLYALTDYEGYQSDATASAALFQAWRPACVLRRRGNWCSSGWQTSCAPPSEHPPPILACLTRVASR
jgi:hypothetical protein